MKYCEKCGNELEDNAVNCDKCGKMVIQKYTVVSKQSSQTNAISILAFILSIIGFMTAWLKFGIILDIIAIVLGIIVLSKSKNKPIKRGLPIAGVIIAALSLIFMLLIYGSNIIETSSKVKNVENMIDNIGEITVESNEAITAAEEKYNELTEEEKEKVDNYTTLTEAKNNYDEAKKNQLLGQAEIIDFETISEQSTYMLNILQTTYNNKIIVANAYVNDIVNDCAYSACLFGNINTLLLNGVGEDTQIRFENNNDLKQFKSGDNIKVVGEVIICRKSFMINNAHLINDEEYEQVKNK